MKTEKELFGKMPDGREVYKYTFTNKSGAGVSILSLGGIIHKIFMPDRDGRLKDIVCGFDTVEGYLTGGGYIGALIGRVGNRIADGKFTLDGKEYKLYKNDGNAHLHGGKEGFNVKLWDCSVFDNGDNGGLVLKYTSPDMEEGYPGELRVTVTYTFDDENRLRIHYEAETDSKTVLNLTNHCYFNLNGYDGDSVMKQLIKMNADTYTAVDGDLIPLKCDPTPVEGTDFDLRTERPIGVPFDHNFNFTKPNGMIKRQAVVCDPESGRTLTLYTDLPAVQFYTGCVMNGPVPLKGGVPQRPLHAFCLETQYAPDSPNRPDFIPTVLEKGEKFDSQTVFEFGVRK